MSVNFIKAKSANGTSFHKATFVATPNQLIKLFGEAHYSDGYKVAWEWAFKFHGKVFTVYDYKDTNLYDSSCPSPEEMLDTKVEWHIGSKGFFGDEKAEEFDLKIADLILQSLV
jgi:hypothetical protein